MNQNEWFERMRKRELRIQYRTKRMEYEATRRSSRRETAEREARVRRTAADVLQADNKKSEKPDKKPGPGTFLALYSYIPSTAYDSRYSVTPSWKPRSFNKRKQRLEFLKSFVYPYPLPETLLWAAGLPEYSFDAKGCRIAAPDCGFIRLAKKWIRDITGGASFYKQNKRFFTKAEAHYFLCSKVPFDDGGSVIKLFFYAKCRARSLNHKLSIMIADVFTVKFINHFKHRLVTSFLDLLARTPEYRYERGMLGDLCDFVFTKIQERGKNRKEPEGFSFSGRTIFSVIALANEWHEDLRREAETRRAQRAANLRARQENRNHEKPMKPIDTSHWKGLGINQFRHTTEECIWTVTELASAQALLNEGRKMKNCVASYAYNCASGRCAIFSVERVYPVSQTIEKAATLEVSISGRALVQAKGKCNSALTPKIMNVVTRWAQANSINVRLLV